MAVAAVANMEAVAAEMCMVKGSQRHLWRRKKRMRADMPDWSRQKWLLRNLGLWWLRSLTPSRLLSHNSAQSRSSVFSHLGCPLPDHGESLHPVCCHDVREPGKHLLCRELR